MRRLGMTQEKLDKIALEIYQEIYAIATPKGDFAKMLESGETAKPDFFLNYVCSENKQYEIMDKVLDKWKVKEGARKKIKRGIILGCSPKFEDYNKEGIE